MAADKSVELFVETSPPELKILRLSERHFRLPAQLDNSAVEETVKKGGYTTVKYIVPPEEVERWTNVAGMPIWKEWVKKMESKGYPEAQQILNTTLEMLQR